jgi:hypothetical protein
MDEIGSGASPVAGVGINGFEYPDSAVTVLVILFDSDKISFKIFKNSISLEDMNLTYDKHQVLCFVFTTRTLP